MSMFFVVVLLLTCPRKTRVSIVVIQILSLYRDC